jgi:hypothetical protein
VPRKTIGTVGALHLDRDLRAEWKPAYKRGYMMQASLSIVGGALKRHPAHEMALHDLCDHADQQASYGHTAGDRHGRNPPHARWGVLHAGRSALGLEATLIFLRAQQ